MYNEVLSYDKKLRFFMKNNYIKIILCLLTPIIILSSPDLFSWFKYNKIININDPFDEIQSPALKQNNKLPLFINKSKPFLNIPRGISLRYNDLTIFFYPKKHTKYVQSRTLNGGIKFQINPNFELYYCIFQKKNIFQSFKVEESFLLTSHIGITFSLNKLFY